MRQVRIRTGLLIFLLLATSLACRLTTVMPASWSGTPTAQAQAPTLTLIAQTRQAALGEDLVFTPTPSPTDIQPSPTLQPTIALDGPWLVYLAPDGGALHAYDIDAERILAISLPEPIYTTDLVPGLSPDGETLLVRSGSALNTDELALYQVDLPSIEITKRSPLLSLTLQRQIVNEEGSRAFETLRAVTRSDGLAWSPDGRFLAFSAALNNNSSDLYVLDQTNNRVERLNGLYTQSATPFWSSGSNWLVSQELGDYDPERGWRAENVSGLRVPGYDDQNTLYLPIPGSQGEVFLGWINAQSFISYSLTADGPQSLRQVNVETLGVNIIFDGLFNEAAFDPDSGSLAFLLSNEHAAVNGFVGGVYYLRTDSAVLSLLRGGDWDRLTWDPGGRFVAAGSQGVFAFSPDGEGIFLQGEEDARLSPAGNWMVAWGNGEDSRAGLRLYQPESDHVLQTLSEAQVDTVFWQPDSKAFFIQSEGSLFRLAFPSLRLEEIETGFPEVLTLDLVWIE